LPDVDAQKHLVELLAGAMKTLDGKVQAGAEIQTSLAASNSHELVNLSRASVTVDTAEGFTPDAMDVLGARNAHGSSRKQVRLLTEFLGTETATRQTAADEYELALPMGEETEMIAAGAVEGLPNVTIFRPTRSIR